MTSRDAISLEQITNRFTRRHVRPPSSDKRLLISSSEKRGRNHGYRRHYEFTLRRDAENYEKWNKIKYSEISTTEYILSALRMIWVWYALLCWKFIAQPRVLFEYQLLEHVLWTQKWQGCWESEKKNGIINKDLAVGYLCFFFLIPI